MFLLVCIYITSLQRFSQCVRRDGEQSEPRWRAKRAPLASAASPVWMAITRSLSVALAATCLGCSKDSHRFGCCIYYECYCDFLAVDAGEAGEGGEGGEGGFMLGLLEVFHNVTRFPFLAKTGFLGGF